MLKERVRQGAAAGSDMFFRLAIVVFITMAFARGFSEIVERVEGPVPMQHSAHPCDDWNNPHCHAPIPR
jgi:hypothetical protein